MNKYRIFYTNNENIFNGYCADNENEYISTALQLFSHFYENHNRRKQ